MWRITSKYSRAHPVGRGAVYSLVPHLYSTIGHFSIDRHVLSTTDTVSSSSLSYRHRSLVSFQYCTCVHEYDIITDTGYTTGTTNRDLCIISYHSSFDCSNIMFIDWHGTITKYCLSVWGTHASTFDWIFRHLVSFVRVGMSHQCQYSPESIWHVGNPILSLSLGPVSSVPYSLHWKKARRDFLILVPLTLTPNVRIYIWIFIHTQVNCIANYDSESIIQWTSCWYRCRYDASAWMVEHVPTERINLSTNGSAVSKVHIIIIIILWGLCTHQYQQYTFHIVKSLRSFELDDSSYSTI